MLRGLEIDLTVNAMFSHLHLPRSDRWRHVPVIADVLSAEPSHRRLIYSV